MKKATYQDHEIIAALRQGNSHQEQETLNFLYREYKPLVAYILSTEFQASVESVEDLFQEALYELFVRITRDQFDQKYTIKAFLILVAKRRWFDQLDKEKVHRNYAENHWQPPEPIPSYLSQKISAEKKLWMDNLLSKMKEKCRQILAYKWFHGYRMAEICTKLGWTSEQATRNAHGKCKKELKLLIEAHPEIRSVILEAL